MLNPGVRRQVEMFELTAVGLVLADVLASGERMIPLCIFRTFLIVEHSLPRRERAPPVLAIWYVDVRSRVDRNIRLRAAAPPRVPHCWCVRRGLMRT